MLLSSLQPTFFLNKLDITRNILWLSNIQHGLLKYSSLRLIFDIAFLLFPVLLTITVIRNYPASRVLAICTAAFSLVYGIFFSGMSYISIEGYAGWMLIPLLFAARGPKGFYYNLHCVRILFILIFVSSAFWKLRAGGVFNIEEMAGILLHQHSAWLISNNSDWFTNCINYLVRHKIFAYCFYLLATVAEALFAAGLFTKKWDKYLVALFCLFVIFDFFLMRINYFGWIVFMGCFYFSKYSLQNEKL